MKLSSVTPLYDEEGTVYLYGSHFTTYSRVYINGEKQKTEYVDPSTLKIIYPELKAGDKISVYQQNSDDHVLTKTEPYSFADDELLPQTSKNNTKGKKKNNKK